MSIGINGRSEDLLGAGHGQHADASTQSVLRGVDFLLDFRLSLRLDPVAFGTGLGLCVLDDLSGTLVGLLDDLGCLTIGLVHILGGEMLSHLQITSPAVGSVKAIGNLLLTLTQRRDDRRPHVLHAEEHEDEEGNGLAYQGCINVHANTSLVRCPSVLPTPSSCISRLSDQRRG